MKILAGKYKGQAIHTVKRATYRPTQSRIRKSLFDSLGNIQGKTFLDTYAGSGIIGFEAVSRDVGNLTLIEENKKTVQLLKRNAELFSSEDIRIIRGDVMKLLPEKDSYDIIFSDPPYLYLKDEHYSEHLINNCVDSLSDKGIYILEIAKKFAQFPADRRKDFGDTTLLFWRKPS